MKRYKHQEITRQIIKGYYEVFNELGNGFLESVYENALLIVLEKQGLEVKKQFPVNVYFRGTVVGEYKADLIVENKVLIELKAVRMLMPVHQAQLINYLKATEIEIGLLMNFGDEPEFKRYIYTNN